MSLICSCARRSSLRPWMWALLVLVVPADERRPFTIDLPFTTGKLTEPSAGHSNVAGSVLRNRLTISETFPVDAASQSGGVCCGETDSSGMNEVARHMIRLPTPSAMS